MYEQENMVAKGQKKKKNNNNKKTRLFWDRRNVFQLNMLSLVALSY